MGLIADHVQEAKTTREALLWLAQGIDAILEAPVIMPPSSGLDEPWDDEAEGEPEPAKLKLVEQDENNVVYEIPPVSEELKAKRREFAVNTLQLDENFQKYPPTDHESWADVYAIGGPEWLYLSDREFVMGLHAGVRAMMVQELTDRGLHQEAREMGRDILKEDAADGPAGAGPNLTNLDHVR